MINVVIRSKLHAFLNHLVVTFFVGMGTALFVFVFWYPAHYRSIYLGLELFRLILLVELILGPLMSLVIYNPIKSRRELVLDYSIVAVIQLSALSYGIHTTYSARPVFEVVVKDRVELVSANELGALMNPLALETIDLPQLGPQLICIEEPSDPAIQLALLDSALQGKDIQYFPEFFRDCTLEDFEARMLSLTAFPGLPSANVDGWLPIFFAGQEYVGWWQEGNSRLAAIEVWNGSSLFD